MESKTSVILQPTTWPSLLNLLLLGCMWQERVQLAQPIILGKALAAEKIQEVGLHEKSIKPRYKKPKWPAKLVRLRQVRLRTKCVCYVMLPLVLFSGQRTVSENDRTSMADVPHAQCNGINLWISNHPEKKKKSSKQPISLVMLPAQPCTKSHLTITFFTLMTFLKNCWLRHNVDTIEKIFIELLWGKFDINWSLNHRLNWRPT